MVRSFLALGSNLGDRETHLREGLAELAGLGVRVIRTASIYSTEPVGFESQPWFLNTAAEIETALEPAALMHACLKVEESRARKRSTPNGPRTLDIDIILFGDRVVENAELTIPHPRFRERRFVLEPLAEIAGDVVDPITRQSIRSLFQEVSDDSGVTLAGPPLISA